LPPAPISATPKPPMATQLTTANNGQTIPVAQGASVELRLPENPTTGYRWTLVAPPSSVAVVEDTYTSAGSMPGSGGERRWVLQAKTPGTAALQFKRWREWEGEASVVERYALTLKITPANGGR
ncbi:MAG: protease inhibitor I42 family protein, partial [Cyanobacteriota bacterium]|nr:protease inhibitor I42 family protein [Cyanobacteriota bacterium]